jgi:poly(beta-D-mannuronate) lyase
VARRALIAFNTVVDSAGPYLDLSNGLGGSGRTLKPEAIVVANNLFVVGPKGQLVTGETGEGWKWQGNLAAGARDARSGIRSASVQMTRGPDGLLRPVAGSAGVGAAEGRLANVTTDIDGQPRPARCDVGCDQSSSEPVTRRPLTAADVGPVWLKR